jgi:gluconokinase
MHSTGEGWNLMESPGAPIVVMGVSGSGKSTVGAALAQRLRVPFADADDFHPEANIAKMFAGHALDDDDRYPWLDRIGEWLAEHADGGVMSCSALKRKYRDQLRGHCPQLGFLHLAGTPEVIGRRQASRPGHFMPASLRPPSSTRSNRSHRMRTVSSSTSTRISIPLWTNMFR